MFPIGTDAPQRRFPLMNVALIAANVIVYCISHNGGLISGLGLKPGWNRYMLAPEHLRLFQFITYQFLHEGFWHITGNMIFLWVFGNNLNDKLGNIPYLLIYLAGGVFAGCGQVLTSHDPTLGASGAISAITGLYFVLLPLTNIRVWLWFYFFEISSMYFILACLIMNFVQQYIFPGDRVAHWAHIVGTFAGFFIGVLLLGTGLIQRDHYDLLAMMNRWRRRKRYETMVAQGYDPFIGSGGGGRGGATGRIVAAKDVPVEASPVYIPSMQRDAIAVASQGGAETGSAVIGRLRDEIATLLRDHQTPEAASRYQSLRALDRNQTLQPQAQLDVANQLTHDGSYADAAGAYENYLRVYAGAPRSEQIELMLGLIYANYEYKPQRAMELLRKALTRLHDEGQKTMAQTELTRLEAAEPAADASRGPP